MNEDLQLTQRDWQVINRLEVVFMSAIVMGDYVHLKRKLFEQIFTAKLALFCSMLSYLKEVLQRWVE